MSASGIKLAMARQKLADAEPETLLARVTKIFGDKLVFATSLAAEDQVITEMIARLALPIPIITLDTGRLFPETYNLLAATEERYRLKIKLFFPSPRAVEEMVAEHGINLFYESVAKRKLCCKVRKLEPLRRALAPYNAWICGLRRDQSVTRGEVMAIEEDKPNGLLKINPLVNWSEEQVWQRIAAYNIPYNELHDRGYPSIGCAACTRAISRVEPLRAGRWWWEEPEHKECGLHRKEEEERR